jgi:acetyl-CoA acyltransferase
MGLTAENVARKFEVSRADQDAFASPRTSEGAGRDPRDGSFAGEIVPVTTAEGGTFAVDEGPRADTTLDALAQLRPVFHAQGSVTAGNSLADERRRGRGRRDVRRAGRGARPASARPLRRLRGRRGRAPSSWASAPSPRSPRCSRRPASRLADIDLIELNEAFASQSLAVIRSSASTPSASTSTAARSRWATRSAAPGPS